MIQALFLAVLLSAIFAFFVPSVQSRLRSTLKAAPARIWLLPLLLTAVFGTASWVAGAFSLNLTALILAYSAAPVLCVYRLGQDGKIPHALDFLAVLLLWLPLEFAAGQTLVPRPAQGFLHSVAYGIAILLGLVLFLGFRSLPGMKCQFPRQRRDFWLPLAAFAMVAPVLVVVGIAIGFIPPPHLPVQPAGRMGAAVGIIFAGTAIPEEILFRALIQNLLMLRFGRSLRMLLLASFIFGCAHLDNGPQPLPNWRYMILATVAGIAYGKVFEMASTLFSSAALHTLVDWTKHFFF
ncbi:MAG TPA: CPBP family intramembrane glutamic endopeptidase [Bryobacteraceae bacterium]